MSSSSANFNIYVERYRGDTVAEPFIHVDLNGLAIDITDRTFVLTVNPSANPTDGDVSDLYQLVGSITDAEAGKYQFPLTQVQADSADGDYFFDIKMTYNPDGGGNVTKTIGGGEWKIIQGIS